jgi:hypothetical protein
MNAEIAELQPPKRVADGARVRTGGNSYSLSSVNLEAASEASIAQWRSLARNDTFDSAMKDPEWLRGYFEGQTRNLFIYSLYQSDAFCGSAGFLLRDWPLKWHLGELPVATLPLKRLRLLGGTLDFPADPAAYDLLFSELAKSDLRFDAIYVEGVPIESFLWKYLHESEIVRKSFLSYRPQAPLPHPILRLEGSFEQYMRKFNSKHRNTLSRKIKKLREGALGEMRLIRFERPQEVSTFLEPAVDISRKTYQWSLHQRGLSATDLVRRRLLFAAEHGWMRSYVLFCGGRACAFLLGFQYKGCFLLNEIGFDPELAKHSVGTVLQFLVVEDLFSYNRPAVFDLQDYGRYKDVLSTESYLEGKLFLFRPGAYARFLRAGHRSAEFVNRSVSAVLDRWNLKSKLRQRMRGWNSSQ